jgi:hypothetical protein
MRLLVWHNTRSVWIADYWTYLGISVVALAAFGAIAGLGGRLGPRLRQVALAALPCLVLCLFLWNAIVRDIMFLLLFLCVFAALGMERLGAFAPRASVVALLIIVVDLSSTSILPVTRTDKQFMLDAAAYLERTAPGERVLELAVQRDGSLAIDVGPDSLPFSYGSAIQRVAGSHDMAATRAINYALAAAVQAQADLRRDGRLSPPVQSLLAVLNVSRIICYRSTSMGCPDAFADASVEGPLGRVVHIKGAAPGLFAPGLALLVPPAGADKPMVKFDATPPDPRVTRMDDCLATYLKIAGIGPDAAMASAIPVRTLPAGEPQAGAAVASGWQPRITGYTVGLARVDMTVESDRSGFIQLAHPFFPATTVTVNGRAVQPLESSIDLITIPLAAGRSEITLNHEITSVRWISGGISAAAFLGSVALTGFLLIRRRERG